MYETYTDDELRSVLITYPVDREATDEAATRFLRTATREELEELEDEYDRGYAAGRDVGGDFDMCPACGEDLT